MKFFMFVLFVLLVSCDSVSDKGEIFFVDVPNKQVYFKKVPINDMEDISTLTGKYFKFFMNSEIDTTVGFYEDINSVTVKEFNDKSFTKGNSPNFRYFESDNAIIPYSLYDTILLTLYYNLQSTMEFFINEAGLDLSKGIDGKPFGVMDILFELDYIYFEAYEQTAKMKDNAMYYPPLNSLGFLKQDRLKHLELVANPMIVAHEFAHSIFAYLATDRYHNNEYIISLLTNSYKDCSSEFYSAAMNEGFSDYWSAQKTKSPDLIYISISEEELGANIYEEYERHLNNNRVLTSNMLVDKCENINEVSISYYSAGTIWASALWEAYHNQNINIENFNKYLLESYSCISNVVKLRNTITMATPVNCFVEILKTKSDISSQQIDEICNIFNNRFSIIGSELYECN